VVEPVSFAAGRYAFVLPGTGRAVRLVSRVARPCDRLPWVEDRRRLGVMVSRLTLRRGSEVETIALDDPRVSQGWWGIERDGATLWRWTDGDAVVPLSGAAGVAVLEVAVAGSLDYPIGREFEPRYGGAAGSGFARSAVA
jgi:hypothetical protein